MEDHGSIDHVIQRWVQHPFDGLKSHYEWLYICNIRRTSL